MTLAEAIWETALAVPLVLMPIRNERMGGSSGPSYTTKASIEARNRALAFLEDHFTIVNKPLAQVGWKLGTHALALK